MRYRPVAIMVVTLSILSNACPPAAATSFRIFSDRVSFNDAAQPRSLIGFEEFPEGQVCPLHVGTDPCGLLTQGVEFVATTYMRRTDGPTRLYSRTNSTLSFNSACLRRTAQVASSGLYPTYRFAACRSSTLASIAPVSTS